MCMQCFDESCCGLSVESKGGHDMLGPEYVRSHNQSYDPLTEQKRPRKPSRVLVISLIESSKSHLGKVEEKMSARGI